VLIEAVLGIAETVNYVISQDCHSVLNDWWSRAVFYYIATLKPAFFAGDKFVMLRGLVQFEVQQYGPHLVRLQELKKKTFLKFPLYDFAF